MDIRYTNFLVCYVYNFREGGKRPWSYMTHCLSGRLRTFRHNQKYKYRQVESGRDGGDGKRWSDCATGSSSSQSSRTSSDSRSRSPSPPVLTIKEEEDSMGTVDNLSTEDYVELMESCRKLVDKKVVKKNDVRSLLKKTFVKRRQEIKKLNKDKMPMISSIIEDWNCFEMGDYVSISISFNFIYLHIFI